MNLAISCARCGRVLTGAEQFSGQKIRCQTCGQIQGIPTFSTRPADRDQPLTCDVYPLAPELPAVMSAGTPGTHDLIQDEQAATGHRSHGTHWRQLVHASIGEASLLELESTGLIALASRLLVTAPCWRSAFYRSNPTSQPGSSCARNIRNGVASSGSMGLEASSFVLSKRIVERHH